MYIYMYPLLTPLIRFPKVYSKTMNKLRERHVINLSSLDDIAAKMSLDIHTVLGLVPCINDILCNIDIILTIGR